MNIIENEKIRLLVKELDLIPIIKNAFIAYSEGKATVPPVAELSFSDPPGDVHIKYGYMEGSEFFVVKIASSFPENEKLGILNGQGMMILFKMETGMIEAILLDNAYLTDVRTAVAGAIVAETFSNEISTIGVLGTGFQARMQAKYLKYVTSCRKIINWGRNKKKMEIYKQDMEEEGFEVELRVSPADVARVCNFIVTTTSSENPLLSIKDIKPGTHITAVGADTLTKQELNTDILKKANLVVGDSLSQCKIRGEISHGLLSGEITENDVKELGDVLKGEQSGRSSKTEITVVDLTGVAVQDLSIANAVYNHYRLKKNEI